MVNQREIVDVCRQRGAGMIRRIRLMSAVILLILAMPFGAFALATPYNMHAPSALQRDATPTAETSSSPASGQDTSTVFNADNGWSFAINVNC